MKEHPYFLLLAVFVLGALITIGHEIWIYRHHMALRRLVIERIKGYQRFAAICAVVCALSIPITALLGWEYRYGVSALAATFGLTVVCGLIEIVLNQLMWRLKPVKPMRFRHRPHDDVLADESKGSA